MMAAVSYAIQPHDHATELKGGILSLDAAHPVPDTTAIVKGSSDGTKRIRFEVDGLTTGTTRVITMADLDLNLTPGTGSYAASLSGLTDHALIRANGATGLQGSSVILDDSGNLSGIGNVTLTGTVDGRDLSVDGAALDAHLINYNNPHQVDADDVLHDDAIWNANRLQGYSIYDQLPANDGVLWWDTTNSRYYATDIDTPLFKAGGRAGVKGELLAGSVSPGKYGYVSPGANGSFLIADSTQTYGLKYDKIAPSGAVVGTTDSQTLTNKTLTTPTIADFTNAGHDHSNAAGGGNLAAKLRTIRHTVEVQSPIANQEHLFCLAPYAATLVEITHQSSAGSVSFNVNKRSKTTMWTSGTNIWTAAKSITTTGTSETSFDSGSVSADQVLVVVFTSPSSIGTVRITIEATID